MNARDTQAVLAVLAALSSKRATGTLRYEPEPNASLGKEFLLQGGRLLFATSNFPGERLGEFLVRQKALSDEQMREALLHSRSDGILLHSHLADRGLIQRAEMETLLYERTEELLNSILQTQNGHLRFLTNLPSPPAAPEAPLVDDTLFRKLLHYRKIWPRVYTALHQPGLRLRHPAHVEQLQPFHFLNHAERSLLSLLDGRRPITEIVARKKNRLDLLILFSWFLQTGLAEIISETPPPGELIFYPGQEKTAADRSDGRADRAEPERSPGRTPAPGPVPVDPAIEELSFPIPESTASPDLAVLGQENSNGGSAVAPAEAPARAPEPPPPELPGHMVPTLAGQIDIKQVSVTGMSVEELFLVSQIDGKTSIRNLRIVAGLPEEEVLRLLHRLIGRGYVVLQEPKSQPTPPPRPRTPPPRPRPPERKAPVEQPSEKLDIRKRIESLVVRVPPRESNKPRRPKKKLTAQQVRRQRAQELYREALVAYDERRWFEAEELLKEAMDLAPRVAEIQARFAIVLLERPGFEWKAEEEATAALERDPLKGACLEALGFVRLKQGKLNQARNLLEQAVLLGGKKLPACNRVFNALKSHKPRWREDPKDFWHKARPLIRLSR